VTLSLAHFERIQPHSFENQRLQRSLIDSADTVEEASTGGSAKRPVKT
jgi:hypothetical protein